MNLPSPAMDSGKNPVGNLLLSALLLAGLLYIFVWSPPSSSNRFFILSQQQPNCLTSNTNFTTVKLNADELDAVLAESATENKTVIIAVVNKAYAAEQAGRSETTMLDLFLESFWLGEETRPLVENLLVVAVDEAAYQRCRFKRLHCYRLVTDGVDYSGEKVYMSTDFIKMMWTRTLFLLDVLKRGYNFIFTDTDVMWLRSPFPVLDQNGTMDLQISVDKFSGDPSPEKNWINTGFYYVRSNNKTISLFDKWYSMKDNATGKKEQDVLLDLMRDGIFAALGLRVRFLDTRYFSGFCEDSNNVTQVTTVHANCCRHINAKIRDLKAVLRNWKQYKLANMRYQKLAANMTSKFRWSPHVGCANSWKGR